MNKNMKNCAMFIRKVGMSFFLLLLSTLLASADSGLSFDGIQQLKKITGTVVDEMGEPVIGANVAVLKGKAGTITNLDGKFSLSVPSGSSIRITFMGYLPKTIRVVEGKLNYKITLQEDAQKLEEVVVIGYGTVKRKDLTGSVGRMEAKEIMAAPVKSCDDALAGKIAGVQVVSSDGQPGALPSIVIRGGNSITQSNAPLYVIDGFPMEDNDNLSINPNEIESIDILKDASATAIYGARGANGVIMITTKQGKAGRTTVTYNGSVSFGDVTKKVEVLSPYEFVRLQLEMMGENAASLYLTGPNMTLEDYRNVKGENWYDKTTQNPLTHSHNLFISGGSQNTKFTVSGSYLNQRGLFINTGFKRYQGRFTLNHSINKKVRVALNANYSNSNSYGVVVAEAEGANATSIMTDVWGYRPILASNTDVDVENELFDPTLDPTKQFRVNPYLQLKNAFRERIRNTLMVTGNVEWKIIKNLTLNIKGGVSSRNAQNNAFNNSKTRTGNSIFAFSQGVNGSKIYTDVVNMSNENTLTYNYRRKKHSLTSMVGFTQQTNKSTKYGASANKIPNESLGLSGIDEGIPQKIDSEVSKWGLLSYLGRVNYNYASRYYLTLSFRADGSSKFAPGNRWAYFPSGALAYRVSEEKFMKGIRAISNLKLRTSWGRTGNNRVGDFSYLSKIAVLTENGYSFGNQPPLQGSIVNTLKNPNLKWETTDQFDIGLDLGLFRSRIDISADYYYKKTHDLLINADLPVSSGYVRSYKNIGSVSNRGFEFTINTVNLDIKDFTWTTSFNISSNKTKVLALADGQKEMLTNVTTTGSVNNSLYIAKVGEPVAQFYGLKFEGTYKYEDFNQNPDGTYTLKPELPANGDKRENIQPGHAKYWDKNKDGTITAADYTVIGDPNPDFIGGFTNTFRYKAFDLSLFFQFSYGNEVFNANRVLFENGRTVLSSTNQFASLANRWSKDNPTSNIPVINGIGGNFYSSRTVEDGSYLRFKTASLGYNFDKRLLKKIGVQSTRLYVAGQNLCTWTKYSGLNPDVSVRSSSALTPAFDLSPYPTCWNVTFGVEITF